mmetsp:Transcript_86323/g.252602  ORF Transcript_86323/g.252602 Transcript_86323/m.252602 type:complete len:206 (+) Transcript_86323:944-1561(+)
MEPPTASCVLPSTSPRHTTSFATTARAVALKTAFSPMRVTMAISRCADDAPSSPPSLRLRSASSSSASVVEYLESMALTMCSSWVSTARSQVTPHGASGGPATGPSASVASDSDSARESASSDSGSGRLFLKTIRASASVTSGPGREFHSKSSSQPSKSISPAASSTGMRSSLQRTVITSSAESSGLSAAAKPLAPSCCAFPSLP